ncbi:MAG: DnaB-like helicase N-terminal domain-containing protein, partial [Panacagrimonas sp.]
MTEPRDLPYSIEAEQSVLGGLMLDNRSWNDVVDRLGDTDFYRADHQLIWRAICELVGSNRPCDFITLTEYLRDREQLEQAGGVAYLGTLANDTPSAANVLAYADIVRERSVLRNLIGAGGQIAELGFRPEGRDPRELLDVAEQQVFAIRERGIRTQSGYLSMAQVLPEVQNKVMQLRENPDE